MQEAWYVLEDGRTVDPNECAPDDRGVLMHLSGVPVAMRAPGVPHSRGVDADAERAMALQGAEKVKIGGEPRRGGRGRSMKPDDKNPGYQTRESKID